MREAIGLLTRLPVSLAGTDRPGAAAFAVVGAFVGAVGAVPLAVLGGPVGEPVLGAIAAIATAAIITGALHLDGLADTADALLARDPVAAERARTDPRLGTGGAIALVLAIGAEVAALASIAGGAGVVLTATAFVAVAAISRAVPVVAVQTALARSTSPGLGSWFGATVSRTDAVVVAATAALVLAAAMAISGAGRTLLVAAIVELGVGLATVATLVRLRGSLDGDGMGAAIEISMVAGLAAVAVVS
ncbi:MAG TPA: adenosylcobinamide-GDP ribazoletransferase [Candidatus Limnocylindrales bacterium]|nr:adenosylcobinamide-GDP ribazoletransferase [Candidatus Limnocylindrales bacterium]